MRFGAPQAPTGASAGGGTLEPHRARVAPRDGPPQRHHGDVRVREHEHGAPLVPEEHPHALGGPAALAGAEQRAEQRLGALAARAHARDRRAALRGGVTVGHHGVRVVRPGAEAERAVEPREVRARRKRFAREPRRDDLAVHARSVTPHPAVQKQLRERREVATRHLEVPPVRQRVRETRVVGVRVRVRRSRRRRWRRRRRLRRDRRPIRARFAEDAPARKPERLHERDPRELPHARARGCLDELEQRREERGVVVAAENLAGRYLAASVRLREEVVCGDQAGVRAEPLPHAAHAVAHHGLVQPE